MESVGTAEGILKVALPLLVPHRKDFYTDFLPQPLHGTLRTGAPTGKKGTNHFRKECLVCFVHVYNKNLPLVGRVRDHDNIEEKDCSYWPLFQFLYGCPDSGFMWMPLSYNQAWNGRWHIIICDGG